MNGRLLARVALMALLATPLAGCVIPITSGDMWNSRQNIGDKVPEFIVVGKTARSDVLLALGEPDGASENDERYTYTRITRDGGTGLLVPFGSGGVISSETMTYRRLNIFFDDGGRVADARTDRTTCSETAAYIGKEPRTAPCVSVAGQDLLSATPPAAAGGGPGVAARIFTPALWHQGVRGFELIRSFRQEPVEIRGSFAVGGESILFFAADADRQSKPVLALRYDEIADIALETFGASRRIVIRRANGAYESFSIITGTQRVDAKATDDAVSLAKERRTAAVRK